ncbi:hypothetical protein BGX30_005784 [Mortierella sp. GBA39]|nr:hypothetical protein BGX30_005784 [Mortierella sp. GBA39]
MVVSDCLSIGYVFAIRKVRNAIGVGTVDYCMSISDDKLSTCSGNQLLTWFYSDDTFRDNWIIGCAGLASNTCALCGDVKDGAQGYARAENDHGKG